MYDKDEKISEESLPVFGERQSAELNNLEVFEYEKGVEDKRLKGLDL